MLMLRRWNGGALAASGLGVLVAVSAHSVVDFGLELPGLAVPILMVVATLTAVPIAEMAPQRRARARLWRGGGALLLAGAAVLLATPLGRTLHEDHNELSDHSPPPLDEAREAMDRHPVDNLSTAYVAAGMFRAGDVGGKYLLNHALLLHPTHPELHRLGAQMLARSGRPAQALVEYNLAITSSNNPVLLVREMVRMFPKPEDAIKALPARHLHPRRIARILIEEGHPEVALPYLKLVVREYPRDLLTYKDLADLAEKQKDHEASEMAARHLARLEPTQENLIGLGHILVDRKKWDEAEKTARRALARHGQLTEVLEANMLLADIYIGAQRWPAARQQLIDMRERPELYLLARREIHRRLAAVEEALGNLRQAEWERQSARGP
jgi:tetratricopeptide (TPR) repeat protein